jgi:hypothetical protein
VSSGSTKPRLFAWRHRALAVALLVASGCAAQATDRVAPFRERPDATHAGSLRGPFTGRVIDGATGGPVADATVYASWSFVTGYGDQVPAGFREHVTSTDAAGRYQVPALADMPAGARLTGAYVVIYKPGYVAYRSDRRFDDRGLRRDFAQRNNEVALARWPRGGSHAEHLRFIGGGEALAEVTADERARAVAELRGELEQLPPLEPMPEPDEEEVAEPVEPAVPAAALPRAADLLTVELVEGITGDEGPFEVAPLGDQPDTETYSSQHLRAVDRPEVFDAALRLWAEGPAGARARYEALEATLPDVESVDELADRSLRSVEPGIVGVAFYDERLGVVGLLVCGEGLCPSGDVAAELAGAAYARLLRGADGEPNAEDVENGAEAEGVEP